MIKRTVLWSLLVALFVAANTAACAAGRDEVIRNPNPDRTWGRIVGGFFSSGKSVAVVIGISNYIGREAGGYPALPSTEHDADKMADFLSKEAGFDIVYVLTDEYATKQKIDRLMTDVIPGVVGQNDRFLFYWSGHGDQMVSGERFFGFLPLGKTKNREFSAMVNMEDLQRWDGYLTAQQALFILDSCLSGLAGVQTKSPQSERLEHLSLPGHHLITAGKGDENVVAGSRWGGSLFTESFILGARGQARGFSGIVTLFSLVDYIQNRVLIEKQAVNWSKSLTPQFRALRAGDGSFFFVPKAAEVPTATEIPGKLAKKDDQIPEQKGAPPYAPEAQAKPEQPQLIFSPWTKFCLKGQGVPLIANAKQVCLTGRDGRVESGMPVVMAALIEPENDPKKVLRVSLPLGMSLLPGTRVIIDNGTPMNGPYVICFNDGCKADYEVSGELIGKLKRGQGLVIQGINGAGQAISLVVPLQDFAKAYDGPPIDSKKFEEQQRQLQVELQRRAAEARKKLESQKQATPQ